MAHKVSQAKLQRFTLQPDTMKNDPDYAIFQAGVEWGHQEYRMKVLTFLEDRYINNDGLPERGSPVALALLQLAKELSKELRDARA